MSEKLVAILLGLVPGVEPRYAIIYAYSVFGEAALPLMLAEVTVLAVVLALAVDKAWKLFEILAERLGPIHRLYVFVDGRRRRAAKTISRWGWLGLALFVAAPLPVTGMYTGAAVALLLGMKPAKTFLGLLLGGLASTLAVYLAIASI